MVKSLIETFIHSWSTSETKQGQITPLFKIIIFGHKLVFLAKLIILYQ